MTPSERRKAQRKLARDLRKGQNPLRGLNIPSRDTMAAIQFGREEGEGGDIPFTYTPTKTTWPGNGWDHRRTTDAGYDRSSQTLRVKFFTNGAEYDYHNVTPAIARQFRRTESPGRFINAVLNHYPYERTN